ncbi:MAG: rhodanese-like domain-containing protein [Xanthomonadaceae bacterium]|nr:rhodanese-like domain-containing protein [Xanthomonadaceae bacterium]
MSPDRITDFIANNLILSLAFLGVTLALVLGELGRLRRKYQMVSPARLTELVNREQGLVVDLRPQAEYEKGHIAGALHLPMSQFNPDSKALSKARELPVVLVCPRGATAGPAADRLVAAGFARVHVLDGGIAAWQQAELPLGRGR